MKKIKFILLISLGIFVFLFLNGCPLFESLEPFECSLVELKENPSSQYYDAYVKVEHILLKKPLKSRFYLTTPTGLHEITDLTFIEEGENPEILESGDVFVVPLQKPDWKFFIREENDIYCSLNFWELLPVKDQWHPTKSEAMKVAESIEVDDLGGILVPAATFLPVEWKLISEKQPDPDYPNGAILYQKLRADIVREEVEVQYIYLTDEARYELGLMSETEFLLGGIEWAKKAGISGVVNGRPAVYWDMQGMGSFGWSYRYAYIEGDLVLEVTISADPLEWNKTEQEKAIERRTEKVFLRLGYGPVGEPEWQILVEIRMNREGVFFKRSRRGITIQKEFKLSEFEFGEIEKVLQENRFLELKSRSGPLGGIISFIAVQFIDNTHTVEMKNVVDPFFQNIEKKIKDIILPKVDESPIDR